MGSVAVTTIGISALGMLSTIVLSEYFSGAGDLGGQVASYYTMRGFLNLMIFPQLFTRGDFLVQGGDEVHLGDTGLAESNTRSHRYEWMVDYAYKQGTPADGKWHKVEVPIFMDSFDGFTGDRPQIQSWWVGRISALKARGSFEVKIDANGRGSFRNVGMEWVAEDLTDAHNFIEGWNDNEPWAKLIAEGIVDIIGDKVLGAQYNLYIHFYDDTNSTLSYGHYKLWN